MSNILKEIINNKIEVLKVRKKIFPLQKLISQIKPISQNYFIKNIKNYDPAIIAEIKKASPSAGIIINNFNLLSIAKIYKKNNVAAISILTEENFFKGDIEYIRKVKSNFDIPILRKDFIIDEYQIFESAYVEADAILLIAKILSNEELIKFVKIAEELNIETIIEIHSEEDLIKALKTKTKIIGINNRDLASLKIDLNISMNLVKKIPEFYIKISESGIKNSRDISKLKIAGFDGFLIGESILKSTNLEKKLKEFLNPDIK